MSGTARLQQKTMGVALVAVLWLVAALTLLTSGVLRTVRLETRMSAQSTSMASLRARIQANMLLGVHALLQPGSTGDATKFPLRLDVPWNGTQQIVTVTPLNGMIDANKAPSPLVTEWLRTAGKLETDAAVELTQGIDNVRKLSNGTTSSQPFLATEDLLRVPGLSYDLYAKIFGFVTASLPDGSGRVNPRYAPVGVLEVLTSGDRARAEGLALNRAASSLPMDSSFLRPDWIDTQMSRCFRIASTFDDSLNPSHVYWSDVCLVQDIATGLPWRVIGTGQSQGSSAGR